MQLNHFEHKVKSLGEQVCGFGSRAEGCVQGRHDCTAGPGACVQGEEPARKFLSWPWEGVQGPRPVGAVLGKREKQPQVGTKEKWQDLEADWRGNGRHGGNRAGGCQQRRCAGAGGAAFSARGGSGNIWVEMSTRMRR